MTQAERPNPNNRRTRSIDSGLALSAGLVVLGVYLSTIYPGIVPIGDAAKFAFVGRILGTPHAPGYPLWVLVSHAFSLIPGGSLAYRMNLLSALFGAAAVVATYAVARSVGAGRVVSWAVAVSLGLGQSFWAIALYAKGYTLNAALVATGICLLLRWSRSLRRAHFLGAVAIFALSAGNHLTVIALVPALVLFAIATDSGTVLQPKTLLASAAIVIAGLSQYLFILVRTLQDAPFLEARARTLGELVTVMTARRFAGEIGAYSPAALLTDRIPIVAGLVRGEMGLVGLALAAAGLFVLASRQPRRAMLLGVGALGITLLTANMSSEEDRGFLLSAFVLLWAIAAVGLQWVVDQFRRRTPVLLGVVPMAAVLLLPLSQGRANYRVNDHHDETFETAYFNALFSSLPEKTAFVRDDYHYNMMLLYKLLGEDAAAGRDVRLVPASDRASVEQLRKDGYDVLAFRSGRDRLAEFGFAFDPYVPLVDLDRARVLRRRELFELASIPVCREVGNLGWMDLQPVALPSGRLSIRLDDYRAFDARIIIYAAADHEMAPAIVGAHGTGRPTLSVERFARGDGTARAQFLELARRDGATLPDRAFDAPFVIRAEARVNDDGQFSVFGLDLGAGVSAVWGSAMVDQDTPRRATLCSHPLADREGWVPGEPRLSILPDTSGVLFDDGWHAIERRDDGLTWRWTTDRAIVVVPVVEPRATTVVVDAEALSGSSVTLVMNGQPLESRPLTQTRTPIRWDAPAGVWRRGLNELRLDVVGAKRPVDLGLGGDSRLLGASVTSIDLVADDQAPH